MFKNKKQIIVVALVAVTCSKIHSAERSSLDERRLALAKLAEQHASQPKQDAGYGMQFLRTMFAVDKERERRELERKRAALLAKPRKIIVYGSKADKDLSLAPSRIYDFASQPAITPAADCSQPQVAPAPQTSKTPCVRDRKKRSRTARTKLKTGTGVESDASLAALLQVVDEEKSVMSPESKKSRND